MELPSVSTMVRLAQSMDDAQAYFMMLAERHEEVTFTVKNEAPFVTAFLGKGPEAKIGFGPSFAAAMGDAMGVTKDMHPLIAKALGL